MDNRLAHEMNGHTTVDNGPPCAPDVERSFVACVMKDPTILDGCRVDAGHFASHSARCIFLAIRNVLESGGEVNAYSVGESLSKDGKLIEVGGAPELADLWSIPTSANWKRLLAILERTRAHRDLHYFARGILRDSEEFPGVESLEGHRDRLERIINRASGLETKKARTFEYMTSQEFAAADFRHEFAIKNVLVKGQPCGWVGGRKMLKTNTGIDAALSLSFGRRFLNRFEVPNPGRVLFISGESGESTIQETAKRIAVSKGVTLHGANILWQHELPQLSRVEDVEGLRRIIRSEGVEYCFLDPLYLSLLDVDLTSNASNMFAMGMGLRPIAEIGTETGCTFVIMHHMKKKTERETHEPPELTDMAYAGCGEFFRQWVLINRREYFDPGSGLHRLWFSIGGSAGHSGLWAVDIDEGQADDHLGGRQWQVSVNAASTARQDAKARDKERRNEAKQATIQDHRDRILKSLEGKPDGQTKNQMRDQTGLNGERFNVALAALLTDNAVESCEILKQGRSHDGYRLSRSTGPDRSTSGQTDCLTGISSAGQTCLSPLGGDCPTDRLDHAETVSLFGASVTG